MDKDARERLLTEYNPPAWMTTLENIPTHRIKAAMENTPIERWYLPDVPEEFEVYIKREDLTGSSLSGNKVRGLEFVFGDAVKHGCTSICSAGSTQSNLVRTTAILAASLGMQAHFVIYADKENKQGNNMLQRLSGAYRYMIPNIDGLNYEEEVWPKVKHLAERIKNETGEPAYIYLFGNPNSICFGYLKVYDELLNQGVESFSDIVSGCATSVTTFGLAVGNHLNGSKTKVHSLVTGYSKAFATNEINGFLRYVGLQKEDGDGLAIEDICQMTEHLGAGYGRTTQEELAFLKRVAAKTGIILGSTYSGKAAYHLVKQLNEQPERFRGKKILFVHTGGIFELFDGRMEHAFDNDDNVQQWEDVMTEHTTNGS